jgi:Ser/Thr protein kinase RdoA (MazF antagonist)
VPNSPGSETAEHPPAPRWRRVGVTAAESRVAVYELWTTFGDPRELVDLEEVSANVSNNRVYRLTLDDESGVFAKVSNYGSYFLFREDHDRIDRLVRGLSTSRFSSFLAAPLIGANGRVHTYYNGKVWAVLYQEVEKRAQLPSILEPGQIETLAEEIADFHLACEAAARRVAVPATSVSIKSDVIHLLDLVSTRSTAKSFQLAPDELDVVRRHAHDFLFALDDAGYDDLQKLPILIDWNLGNFSIDPKPSAGHDTFRIYSRWDYDWFRIEPLVLDFYFLSRVASETGDRTRFSYGAHTLTEPRFLRFVEAYHRVRPLREADILLLKEAYRFFILHYVLAVGDHFFRADLWAEFQTQSVHRYLPSIDTLDLRPLLRLVANG